MYDQLVAYCESLTAVGQRLDQPISYEQARKPQRRPWKPHRRAERVRGGAKR